MTNTLYRPSKTTLTAVFTVGYLFSAPLAASAFEPAPLHTSQSDFGGVGLMQMPTGRMAPEGEFNLSGTFNEDYYHASVSLQLMPWLETTIRYTQVQDLLYNTNSAYSGDNEYTDKGIDFKIRLLQENDWLPETSIGVRDFGGTGLFDGEFVAATKRVGNLDFTMGIGWGYLGTRNSITNPFCKVADTFCQRNDAYTDNGGSVDYQRWFKGSSALFGGIEYQTPIEPLRLKVEYDSNDYSQDFPYIKADKDMSPSTAWNVGVLYDIQNWGDLRVSYERGNTLTVGFSLHSNFNDLKASWRDTEKPSFEPRASSNQPDWPKVAQAISENAGYEQTTISATDTNIIVTGEPSKYRQLDLAHERAALLLSQNRSETIETYTFVDQSQGLDIMTTTYDADKFDDVAGYQYIGAKLDDAKLDDAKVHTDDTTYTQLNATKEPEPTLLAENRERLNYGIEPTLSQSFGGPESFYLYAIGVTGSASYRLTNNLEIAGAIYFNIYDNYDKFNYVEENPHIDNFSVPRVRTLFRYYVTDNPVRMNQLQLTWFEQLGSDVFFQGYGGYLESMFAGVGGEILYRPAHSNWAIGADATLISQRDPSSWFSLYDEDYFEYSSGCTNGVLDPSCAAYVLSSGETGFINLYYTPQWEIARNTRFKLSVGQFLGQDKGVRMDFSKQFDSGIITGAYASLSDLTADEYGEGSFTKGFYISFPLDILTVKPSRSRAQFNWQPITRDGGQTLAKKYELFNVTDSRSPWFNRPTNR